MSIERDPARGLYDLGDGAQLLLSPRHPHDSTEWWKLQDAIGRDIFSVTFRAHSIDQTNPDPDPPYQRTLIQAGSFDQSGRFHRVFDDHDDLTRILDYIRRCVEAAEGKFVLRDHRLTYQNRSLY